MPTPRKLTAAQWNSNRRLLDPTRPARIVSRRVICEGSQVREPQYEAEIVCDDNKVRTFVSSPDGRWVRKVKPQ